MPEQDKVNEEFSVENEKPDISVEDAEKKLRTCEADLSEQQKSIEALARLAAIVESSEDAIIGKTLDGIITSWNEGAERIYGYAADEIIGKPIFVLVPPDHPNEIPSILEKIRRGERVKHYETERIRKNGERLYISLAISPIKDNLGNIIGASTIARDVTGLKHAENALRESEQMFRSVFDSSVDALLIVNDDRIYIDANPAACALFGMPRQELIGHRIKDFTDPDFDTQLVWNEFIISGKGRGEYRIHSADGSIHYVEYNAIKDVFPGKHLTSLRDITERKQTEIERENARKDLEEVYERERRIAETLQRNFLPDRHIQINGYLIADSYNAALEEAAIGGDVYDVFRLPNQKVGFLVADVSGKGLKAARYGAMVKYMLRAYSYQNEDPAKVLEELNNSIVVDLDIDSFVTCIFGVLDPQTREFVYANAGHDEPLHFSSNTGDLNRLKVTGRALGLLPDADYKSEKLTLSAGDILFFYTDGLTDARGVEERMGIEGIEEYMMHACDLSAESLVKCMLDEVMRRSGEKLADDVAMLALEVLETS